jgi:uncharacterized protein YaeQ
MALKATIFKAELSIADMDRAYYADHSLTLARHPSETDERMMARLLAFALYADAGLGFGKGLCVDDEPDLWLKDLTGAIELWIDVGLPDEKWLKKACNRAARVVLLSYGGRQAEVWWAQIETKLARMDNLAVLNLPAEASQALANMAARTMRLQWTVQDGHIFLTDGAESVHLQPVTLKNFTKN